MLKLTVNTQTIGRTQLPDGLEVEIVFATLQSQKSVARLKSVEGNWEPASINVKGPVNLQAVLRVAGSDLEYGRSAMLTNVRDSAHFQITYVDPTPKPPLFTRIDNALNTVAGMPAPATDEHTLVLAATNESSIDVARYFLARALGAELGRLAREDATAAYASYLQSADDAKPAQTLIETLQVLNDRQALLPEMAFALLSSASSTSAPQSITLGRDELTNRLKRAVDSGQVADWSRQRGNSLNVWTERLIALRDGLHLRLSTYADRKGQMIVLADIPLSKASALLDHALNTGGFANPEKLRLTKDEVARLDLAQKLVSICDDDMKLAATFMAQHSGVTELKPGQRRTLKADGFIAALVSTPASEWEKLATRAATTNPQNATRRTAAAKPSADQKQSVKSTASRIAAKILVAEPRAALVAQVSAPAAKRFSAAAELLKQHTDFDPTRQSAESYFRGAKAVSTEKLENLKSFQRLVKISPEGHKRVEVASALLAAGFRSAAQIVQAGKIDFLATMTASGAMLQEEVREVYCRAREIADLRAELEIRFHHSGIRTLDQWNAIKNDLLAEAIDVDGGSVSSAISPPNLEAMFGSFDACACSECQSVHSAASYLHNLLYWMKSDVVGAWSALSARRPDIKDLLLSCANTHTTLPYIDIVNEFLCKRIKSDVLLPTETTWKEPALRLQPEFRFPTAEALLKTKYFPLTLPYDRPRMEGEAALRAIGMPVENVMEIFLPGDRAVWSDVQRNAHVASRLGLSSWAAEFVVSVTVPSGFWTDLTGTSTPPPYDPFNPLPNHPSKFVGKAMQAIGVEYQKLLALVSLDYVRLDGNGNEAFVLDKIIFADDKCSYEDAKFGDFLTAKNKTIFTDAIAMRALQIMRLAQATGFDETRIDALLKRFVEIYKTDPSNPTPGISKLVISQAFLNFLERLKTIEDATKVSFEASCGLIETVINNAAGNFDTAANINLFVDLYKLRSSDDVVRCYLLFGDGVASNASFAERLAARLERLQILFGVVVDTAKIPKWIEPLSANYVKPVFLAIKAKLFAEMNAVLLTNNLALATAGIEGPLDRNLLEERIVEAVSESLGVSKTIAQQVYVARTDTWFDDCLVAKMSSYPVAIPDLGPYILELWDAAMHQWLADAILCCGSSAALSGAIIAAVEPVGFPPDYSKLNQNFVVRLARLRTVARTYRLREELLGDALFGAISSLTLPLVLPSLVPSWTEVVTAAPSAQDQLVTLEHALRLASLCATTGKDAIYFSTVFSNPTILDWSSVTLTPPADNAAQLTISIALTQVANTRVMTVLQDGMDDVRKSFRDALVDYVLLLTPALKNIDGIYKELLLDPAMQPCMLTSRLVLATSSVQLLMHRAILNLEIGIIPDADNKEEFEWRKNFRVWEANVKVLLYPENWIEPELSLDPTPLFKDAVAALSQDEVTEAHCETVLYDYLSGLDKIARLDIRAFYRDEKTNTLHVFGRSWNAPYEYYYRRRTDQNAWTPWEKIDIDIEGDHLIPVMFHRRLWLFWPIFVEKEHRDIKVSVNGEQRGAPYLEIRMAYTTYEHGRWRGKKLVGPALEAGSYCGPGVAMNLEGKLGPKYIQPQESTVFSDLSNWSWPESDLGALSLQIYLGALGGFKDYSKVSLSPNGFFFWAEEAKADGRLQIRIRRDYSPEWENRHDAYTEMAYEDGFEISACGGVAKLVAASPKETPFQNRFVARPFMTLPKLQNMISGLDVPANGATQGLYAKNVRQHSGGSVLILQNIPSQYQLTYPQRLDCMWSEPFFMADDYHTHFFERRTVCKIVGIEHLDTQNERYDVALHEHPYACLMISNFNRWGIDGLYAVKDNDDGLRRQAKSAPLYFKTNYDPGTLDRINLPLPVEEFDFAYGGAYSVYNWELFFHLPTLIARRLKTEGRHREAIRWLSLVFDPTSREPIGTRRVWRVKPFMTASTQTSIATMVKLLSQGTPDPVQEKMRQAVEAQIRAWRDNPFEPHQIAESRLSAYMLWCVLEYVDVLIEWGDELFRQDSMEAINEATNLYLLAKEILGERPTVVDKGSRTTAKSFSQLQAANAGSGFSADLEAQLAGYDIESGCRSDGVKCRPAVAASLFPGQYFCVPPNPKLPEYWDRVEDRLFKIRHCRNLDGEQRSLALFQPPIDPALLVRARAAGLSIEDVLAGLAEAQLPYRFQYLLGKAQDFTAEVKALGGQLLSAIEKKDAEELSQIRQTHELNIQRATRNLKLMSLAEAKEGLAALQHSLKGIEITLSNYEDREFMNSNEQSAYDLTKKADDKIEAEQTTQFVASILRVIPQMIASVPPAVETGGAAIGGVPEIVAATFGMQASTLRSEAGRASTLGSYDRRAEERSLQIDTSRERIKELIRQIVSAEIRIQTAEKDLEVFDLQIEQSKEIYDYMRSKFSNEQLYSWMAGQLKTFHRGAYSLAANMARQAQMAFKRELGDSLLDVLTANHWDSSRAGLLAGEKLSFELKKLDDAYMRAKAKLTIYELSRTVSLRRLDPVQLFSLRSGNPITVLLPEWLFKTVHADQTLKDMRIKTVSISLPCTVGPNTQVPLKVRLTSAALSNPVQKMIITSTAQGDSGRFDPNPNGETYLPFENEIVVNSKWEITLPKRLEFNPATISDLIFNIRYTAQPDTQTLLTSQPLVSTVSGSNEGRFGVSLRYDNYDDWLQLQRDLTTATSTLKPLSSYFPPKIVEAATPYVYTTSAEENYYFMYEDSTPSGAGNMFSSSLGLSVPNSILGLNGSKIVHPNSPNTSRIVTDIVQIRKSTI